MRDIKFRAWDKATKTMYKRVSINGDGQVEFCCNLKPDGRIESYPGTAKDGVDYKKIIPMQYTGRKVKNGEIYEGDIVQLSTHTYPWVIEWKDSGFVYRLLSGSKFNNEIEFYPVHTIQEWGRHTGAGYDVDEKDQARKAEIIGNIYQNSELLDSKKK